MELGNSDASLTMLALRKSVEEEAAGRELVVVLSEAVVEAEELVVALLHRSALSDRSCSGSGRGGSLCVSVLVDDRPRPGNGINCPVRDGAARAESHAIHDSPANARKEAAYRGDKKQQSDLQIC